MKNFLLLAIILLNNHFIYSQVSGQQLIETRYSPEPSDNTCSDCVFYKRIYDDNTPSNAAILNLMDAITRAKISNKKVIKFLGEVKFYQPLDILSIFNSVQASPDDFTFRGISSGKTSFIFSNDIDPNNACININGSVGVSSQVSPNSYLKTTTSGQVNIASSSGFNIGDVVRFDAINNSGKWAGCKFNQPINVGHVFKIKTISGNLVTFEETLNTNYAVNVSNPATLIKMVPIRNFKIENLKIARLSPAAGRGAIIRFSNAINSSVLSVETINATGSHILFDIGSKNNTVSGCYLHEASDYGGGGHGYGIEIASGGCNNIISNNVLRTLRHHMLVQAGANGNIFQENFSEDTRCDAGILPCPDSHPADIEVHGNFPYNNTFINNRVAKTNIGQGGVEYCGITSPINPEHAINGENNTFINCSSTTGNSAFTRWATTQTGTVFTDNGTCNENTIGIKTISNCYGDADIKTTLYITTQVLNGATPLTYLWKDVNTGAVLGTQPDLSLRGRSSVLAAKWISLQVTDNCNKVVFFPGVQFDCNLSYALKQSIDQPNTKILNKSVNLLDDIVCYPNPSQGEFVIHYNVHDEEEIELNLQDITGRIIKSIKSKQHSSVGVFTEKVTLMDISRGIYFVSLKTNDGNKVKKIVIQ